jgi:hypothetical protein
VCARGLRVRLSHGRLPATAIFFLIDAFEHAERRLLRFIRRIVGLFGRLERRIFRRLIQQHAQRRFERWLAKLRRFPFIGWLERRWRFVGWRVLFSRRQSGFLRRPERWRLVGR